MKLFHKMFFTAFVGMMFVGNVSAMGDKGDKNFIQNAMKYGYSRKEAIVNNPAAISGIVLGGGLTLEELGYEKAGRIVTESGLVGEGYALMGGSVQGTCAAMGTNATLHIGTEYLKGNETAKNLAKYVNADTSFGKHVWRTLASFFVGFMVDTSLSKDTKDKIRS